MSDTSNYFKIIVLFFSCIQVTFSQDNRIEHVIKKNDNVYRISLHYNVTMDEIFNLNPGSKELIKIGDVLYIPKISSKSQQKSNLDSQNYLVSKGETKYGISKSYGISITELENANPFIINGLQVGHKLKIPNKNDSTQSINSNLNQHIVNKGETLWGISQKYDILVDDLIRINTISKDDILKIGQVLNISNNQVKPNTYLVKKGDTKYGLSKKFGVSIPELEHLNPEIVTMLKTGTLIKVENSLAKTNILTESSNFNKKEDQTISNTKTYIIQPKETIYSIAKKAGISNEDLIALNPKLKTAVLAGDTIRLTNKTDESILAKISEKKEDLNFNAELDWTEPLEKNSITKDYLDGLKHAIIRAKSSYPKMTLVIKNDSLSNTLSLNKNQNKSIRFNIKPNPSFLENPLDKLSTFSITESKDKSQVTYLIKGLPSEATMRSKTINYLKSENKNIICLYDNDHLENLKLLKKENLKTTLIKINKKNIFKSKELENSLDKENKNYVIIESSKVGVFLSATSLLLKKSSSYDIQLVVLNSNNIPDSSKISYNRFKILNLTYPMPYNPNYLKEFSNSYRTSYLISCEIFNRLNTTNGINAFKNNTSTSFLGTYFNYDFNNNIAENKAVSIYMFNDDSNSYLIGTY